MTRPPSRRARGLVAAVVLPVLLVIAAVAFWPRPATEAGPPVLSAHHAGLAPTSAAQHPAPTRIPAPTPPAQSIDGPPPGSVPLAPPPDSPVGGDPGTTLADAASDASTTTRNGAEELGAPRDPVDPSDVVPGDRALGGCLAAYGEDGQCLSAVPPSLAGHAEEMRAAGRDPAAMAHPWTCGEVRTYFPDGIALREPGTDPLRLDSDGDAVACGAGD